MSDKATKYRDRVVAAEMDKFNAAFKKDKTMPPNPHVRSRGENNARLEQNEGLPELLAVFDALVAGNIGHLYRGSCPDPSQPHLRDSKCPACARIDRARTALAGSGGKPSWIDPERTITYPPPSKEKE